MRRLTPLILLCLFLALLIGLLVQGGKSGVTDRYGEVIHETRSDFSHIRIRERGQLRSLWFVDSEEKEQCQTALDLATPGRLQHGYARALLVSLLYQGSQERVLILGLGGGALLHFFQQAFPTTQIEAVEIDPVVVELADRFFGTRSGPQVSIHVADAFDYFSEAREPYDAIYLDAFLRVPEDSELGDRASRLKTVDYLRTLRAHLRPGGVVAFNLAEADPGTPEDLEAIRQAFPAMELYSVPNSGNLVVIALTEIVDLTTDELRRRAEGWGARADLGFSLREIARQRRERAP